MISKLQKLDDEAVAKIDLKQFIENHKEALMK
jgi:hypothetical protein